MRGRFDLGTKATLIERDQRFYRLRQAMENEGLDVLLIAGKGHGWTGRGYFRWLTDFHLWGHDAVILFPLEGDPMLSITSAALGRMIAQTKGWITDCRGDWYVTPKIVEELKQRRLDKGRIGVAGHDFIIGAGAFNILKEGLPAATLVNADMLMNRVRAIRSPLEIQQYRELWTVSKAAMERFVTHLEPGMTQLEASMESVRYIHQNGARDYLILINGKVPGEEIVEWEDVLSYHMEICNASSHYNELTVTLSFRDQTQEEAKLHEDEFAAYDAIQRAAKPGVTLGELFQLFEDHLRESGWELSDTPLQHYEFHGQGMDWIEWPTFSPDDPSGHKTKLEAGMVLNYHPAANLTKSVSAAGINDQILITSEGAQRLSGDWDMRWRRV